MPIIVYIGSQLDANDDTLDQNWMPVANDDESRYVCMSALLHLAMRGQTGLVRTMHMMTGTYKLVMF